MIIASNNKRYTETLSNIVPTSTMKDVVQIWLREYDLASCKNEQMASKSHLHKPNLEATSLGLEQQLPH